MIRSRGLDRGEALAKEFDSTLRAIFERPDHVFSECLSRVAQNYVLYRVLNTDPTLRALDRAVFDGVTLYLDTNVLIGLLCEGSERHNLTTSLVASTRSLGVTIRVTERTAEELDESIKTAERKHRYADTHGLDVGVLDNEIIRTFYRQREQFFDWNQFTSLLRNWRSAVGSKHGIDVLKSDPLPPSDGEVAALRQAILDFGDVKYYEKHPALIQHDAYCLSLIRRLRSEGTPAMMTTPWFLTHDFLLQKVDSYLSRKSPSGREVTLSTAAWVQIITPFLGYDLTAQEAGDLLARMVSLNTSSSSGVSIEDFLAYVESETHLASQDMRVVLRVVSDTVLSRTLQKALDKGQTTVALRGLEQAISSAAPSIKENDELRRRFQTVSAKMRAGSQPAPAGIYDSLRNDLRTRLRPTLHSLPENEKDFQDSVENLLILRGFDYDRENFHVPVSSSYRIPDFVVDARRVALEVKLLRDKGRERDLVEEISADITHFGDKFEKCLFLILDTAGTIRSVDQFSKGLVRPGVDFDLVKW